MKSRLKAPIRPGSLCQAMYELTTWKNFTKNRSNDVGLKFGESMVVLGLELAEFVALLGFLFRATACLLSSLVNVRENSIDLSKREKHLILFGPGDPAVQSHDPTVCFSSYMHCTAHELMARYRHA